LGLVRGCSISQVFIRRAQEQFRRESARSKEMLEQMVQDHDQFRARNEELQQQISQQMINQQGVEEEDPDFQPFVD